MGSDYKVSPESLFGPQNSRGRFTALWHTAVSCRGTDQLHFSIMGLDDGVSETECLPPPGTHAKILAPSGMV